jgi:hypothetical protein
MGRLNAFAIPVVDPRPLWWLCSLCGIARRWIIRRTAPSPVHHRGLPASGYSVRVYLARNAYDGFTNQNKDGGFNVVGPNGFEVLKKGPGQ